MRIQYSDYGPVRLRAHAVREVVCIAHDDDVEGYGSPAEARAFAAELIAAAEAAEAYVLTPQDIADDAEALGCSKCGEPRDAHQWNWCTKCVEAYFAR